MIDGKNELVNFSDVGMINKKSVNELIEILNLLNIEVLEKTELISKKIKEADEKILISKEDLDEKLKSLDSYLTKVATIQKEVIGDKGLKKQSKEIVKLITDDFKKIKGEIEEIQKKEAETFEKRIERIEKLKGNNTLQIQKVVDDFETKWQKKFEEMLQQKTDYENTTDDLIRKMSDKLNVNTLKVHLEKIEKIEKSLVENLKEANALQKTGLKGFLYGLGFSVFIFGVAFFLNTKLHFF